MEPNVKYQVHEFKVSASKQKLCFQIRHPENVFAVAGIFATVDYALAKSGAVGSISLSIPEKGDVFFGEVFLNSIASYKETYSPNIFPFNQSFFSAGQSIKFFDTWVEVSTTMLEGFYENYTTLNASTTYTLRVYIKYIISNPTDHDS